MVLQLAYQHLVAFAQKSRAPALSDKIDCLGRATHKDDFAAVGGIEKPADLVAGFLVELGRACAQPIDAAMHIGIVGAVVLGDAVDDRTRFLRAGGGIEKHQIGVVRENRKLAPQPPRVQLARCVVNVRQSCRRHPYSSKFAKRRATRDSKCSRTGAGSTSSTASRTKASINIRRASAFGMPRARR